MKKLLFIIFFFSVHISAFSQVSIDLVNQYNELFYEGDFEKAITITTQLVASNPHQLDYLREHLKMLAGNQKKVEFKSGMIALREIGSEESLKQFFLVLKSGIVPLEYINDLKNYFFKHDDFEVLSFWDPKNYKEVKPFKAVLEEIKRKKSIKTIDFTKEKIETPTFNKVFKNTGPSREPPKENPKQNPSMPGTP